MRCLIRGALLGTIFFVCSVLYSQLDIQDRCTYHIEYDQYRNPIKLSIEAYRVVTPMTDGILLLDQQEEYACRQEYAITEHGIEEQKNSVPLQVSLPKHTKSVDYKIPESQLDNCQKQSGFYASVQAVPHQAGIFESMSDKQLRDYVLYNAYCKKHYHMDACAKLEMMTLSCQRFKDKLLSNQKLSEQAVLELLNDYLVGCHQKKQKYKDLEKDIKHVVQQRIQQKLSEAKQVLQQTIAAKKVVVEQELHEGLFVRQQFVQQQHKAIQDVYWCHDVVSDEIAQARQEAFDQSEVEGYKQYDQSYELDAITCGYLLNKNIAYLDYLHCHGTALQHQYHKEICDIVTQAAHQHVNITNMLQADYRSPIIEHATNFAQAAHETNQKNWLPVTAALSSIGQICVDLCKELYSRPLDYIHAVKEGVLESAYDLGYMIIRFDKTFCGLGQMLYFALETGAMTEAAIQYPEANMQVLQERHDQITHALSVMQKEFSNKDGPARVKAITKFGADFYLPAKLIHAAGYLMRGIFSRARGMKTLEGVSSLLDESLLTVETVEKIREIELATEQGLTQKVAAEFMEAESAVVTVAKMPPRPLKVIVDEIKTKYNGIIPPHCENLYKEFNSVLKLLEKKLENINLNELKKLYEYKMIDNK